MKPADTKHLDCPHAVKLKRLQEVARLTMYAMVWACPKWELVK